MFIIIIITTTTPYNNTNADMVAASNRKGLACC